MSWKNKLKTYKEKVESMRPSATSNKQKNGDVSWLRLPEGKLTVRLMPAGDNVPFSLKYMYFFKYPFTDKKVLLSPMTFGIDDPLHNKMKELSREFSMKRCYATEKHTCVVYVVAADCNKPDDYIGKMFLLDITPNMYDQILEIIMPEDDDEEDFLCPVKGRGIVLRREDRTDRTHYFANLSKKKPGPIIPGDKEGSKALLEKVPDIYKINPEPTAKEIDDIELLAEKFEAYVRANPEKFAYENKNSSTADSSSFNTKSEGKKTKKEKRKKPSCFGDANVYDEDSEKCNNCPFELECSEEFEV